MAMEEHAFFRVLLWAWAAVAVVTAMYLFFVSAPYGRHARKGWGATWNPKLAWILMELPAMTLVPAFFLASGDYSRSNVAFVLIWSLHYVHRTIIFPFRMRLAARMPVLIAGMGFLFNLVNGYTQGTWLFRLSPPVPDDWLFDPRFIAGLLIFLAGFVINIGSDTILRGLRRPGETGYRIPRGGLFRWVSAPNYFGEILEWTGWAILTWSWPGALFAFWTAANLVPRAVRNHQWYKNTFPEYPEGRKAVIPFVL